MQAHEILKPRTRWRIRRYPDQAAYERGELTPVLDPITGELLPAESEIEGNLLLNEGIAELHNLIAATGGTKWDNTNARLGVGDSAAAEGAGQTVVPGPGNDASGAERLLQDVPRTVRGAVVDRDDTEAGVGLLGQRSKGLPEPTRAIPSHQHHQDARGADGVVYRSGVGCRGDHRWARLRAAQPSMHAVPGTP